jgi:hypothetical protein
MTLNPWAHKQLLVIKKLIVGDLCSTGQLVSNIITIEFTDGKVCQNKLVILLHQYIP